MERQRRFLLTGGSCIRGVLELWGSVSSSPKAAGALGDTLSVASAPICNSGGRVAGRALSRGRGPGVISCQRPGAGPAVTPVSLAQPVEEEGLLGTALVSMLPKTVGREEGK